jgi:NAD(P)-dependent dehydrogenase (short-subunit alcohol dehydrogenase family)
MTTPTIPVDLTGQIALVAGVTRVAGRGIAVELGAAGVTMCVTGRTTADLPSPMQRPEAIHDTARLVNQDGGTGMYGVTDVDGATPDWGRDARVDL